MNKRSQYSSGFDDKGWDKSDQSSLRPSSSGFNGNNDKKWASSSSDSWGRQSSGESEWGTPSSKNDSWGSASTNNDDSWGRQPTNTSSHSSNNDSWNSNNASGWDSSGTWDNAGQNGFSAGTGFMNDDSWTGDSQSYGSKKRNRISDLASSLDLKRLFSISGIILGILLIVSIIVVVSTNSGNIGEALSEFFAAFFAGVIVAAMLTGIARWVVHKLSWKVTMRFYIFCMVIFTILATLNFTPGIAGSGVGMVLTYILGLPILAFAVYFVVKFMRKFTR